MSGENESSVNVRFRANTLAGMPVIILVSGIDAWHDVLLIVLSDEKIAPKIVGSALPPIRYSGFKRSAVNVLY